VETLPIAAVSCLSRVAKCTACFGCFFSKVPGYASVRNCRQTELGGFDDVEVGTVEERPLDDAALEVRPVDAVVDEVVFDADRSIERRQFDGRHAP